MVGFGMSIRVDKMEAKTITDFLLTNVPAVAVLVNSSKNALSNHPDELPSYVAYHLRGHTKPNREWGTIPIEISLNIYADSTTGVTVNPSISNFPPHLAMLYAELITKVAELGLKLLKLDE